MYSRLEILHVTKLSFDFLKRLQWKKNSFADKKMTNRNNPKLSPPPPEP